MIKRLQLFIVFVFLCIPYFAFSTHIVGGTLTYVHNGGSSYTITLKLYRDCSPTSAQFPGSVNIDVAGYNGASFTPSRDIVMTLGTVTNVPSNLDPCAVPPTPLPCVQEGIYTITVNNLPPNPGGYHLSYQIVARNLSLSNTNGACNCIGESFYAYIPGTPVSWGEDFNLANNTTVDAGPTAWTIAAGAPAPASAKVTNGLFEITGANNGRETWTSQNINISSCSSVNVKADLSENGTLDANDSIFVYYRINGGPLIPFSTNGFIADDFANAVASVSGLSGTNLQIVIRVHYDANSPNSEIYRFDNILVSCNNFATNSNPTFDLFPPLFLCVGTPFTFDHSATDINGDSLYYSFYTPYDGDNGVGPLDPTYPNNTATFTPIVWNAGYGTNNPLGGAPLTLNPYTGVMTGTPTSLGQFVVGVVVKEYRNGVYISQTLRDFQFNIVNCPSPPVAVGGSDITINDGCVGHLKATGYNAATVTWNSIYPGLPGAYNNYLSCTAGCLNPNVLSVGTPPPYVDYQVCGMSSSCNPQMTCDTVRVTLNPTLHVSIVPLNPTICFGQTSTIITANGSGGTPPYSYLWNNINPSQSISVGTGNYNVVLSDASGCPPVNASVAVTAFAVPITANAGVDDTVCIQNPVATLNASVTGASGGIWSGGAGTFSPNNTTLAGVSYIPTAAELAAGFVNLTLTTTGNGTCPAASDVVKISFMNFTGTVTVTPVNISCFGGNNGSATVSIVGGVGPFTYLWNTAPSQNTATASNLSPGTYTVTIQSGIGCSYTASTTITQPTPLALTSSVTNVSCFSGNDGTISITPNGGTATYTYLWSPGGQTTSSITGQTAGTYTVMVTDFNGCQKSGTYTITQPTAIAITIAKTNVSCFSGNNGTATATVNGGTPPYAYNWSPSGGSASNTTGLSAGTYTVTATDSKGCTATASAVITEPVLLSATVSVTNETCDYANNGTATVTPSGGTPGYTYLWQPGNLSGNSNNNLTAGTYTITVTDSKSCTATVFAVITQPVPLAVNFTGQANVNCFGGTTGSVKANPSGGTPAYSYSWNPGGATTQTLSGVGAGTYTVTITDINGCQVTNQVTITQPAQPLAASAVITDVSCSGGSNGSISVTASGGTSPYAYLWTPGGQTTATITSRPSGNYSVRVTDSKGCVLNSPYTIGQPSALAITFTKTNVSCFGGNNGTASATVTGGTAPYLYSWSPSGGNTANVSGLSIGTYTLTVTDSKSCTKTGTVVITQPTVLSATTSTVGETCNYSDNGSATVVASGGTPGYTYLWQPGNLTTSTITGLTSGTYTVTVTDLLGCTKVVTATVGQPAALSISFNSIVNVSCFGGNNGSVSATSSGGTPNYTYLWAPGGQTTSSISGLAAGTYTLTIKDSRNCTFSNTVTINQPAVALSSTVSSTPTTCFGNSTGTVTANGVGGTAPYTYKWMPGNLTGQTISGLSAGTYTVTTKDIKGCTHINTVTVTQPPKMVLTTSTVNSNCGNPTGQASVVVSGGTAPYTYLWSNGQTTATATGLVSGPYTVTVTDLNGCTASQFANVNDNSGPTATIFAVVNVSCYGGSDGSASVGVAGGTGPFTYTWLPFGGNSTTATGLSAGTYTVTVQDFNGCRSNATTSPDILQPPPIVVTTTTTNVNCFGGNDGSATVSATGGTPGYVYQWLPGGTAGPSVSGLSANNYSVKVTDTKNCVQIAPFSIGEPSAALSVGVSSTSTSCFGGSDGTVSSLASGGTAPYNYNWMPGNYSGQSISNLPAGTYTVTASDVKGCTITNTVAVNEPTPVVLTAGSINSNCSTSSGLAYVSATGGTVPYNYLWSPTGSVNDTIKNVLAGTYLVTVTDNNSCVSSATIIINDNASPIATITSTSDVSCNGGSDGTATVTVTGGTGPFTYLWLPSGGTNATATGLSAASYTISVTDAHGCIGKDTTSPDITEPTLISLFVSSTDVSCFGGNNGTADVMAFGGTPGYTYQWLPGGSTSSSVSGLTAGTYTVNVRDANSCLKSKTLVINQPALLSATISSSSNVNCFGGDDGSATVNASGGTPSYTYNWLPYGGTNATATRLSAGSYTVTVTDEGGCTTTASILITQPSQALSATGNGSSTSCFGGSNGSASVIPVGGTPGYSYVWSPFGGTAQSATGLTPGTYSILITDANGCQTNTSIVISQPSPVSGTLDVKHPSCGFTNGSISTMVSGGTGSYTYLWSPGSSTNSTLIGVGPGIYSVTIKDSLNCSITLSATLTNIPGPTVSIASFTDVSCFGGNDGSATANVVSGSSPYSYSWLPFGGNNITGTSLIAGTYTVQVTDSLGCNASATVIISEPPRVNISISSLSEVSCNGGNNGTITVIASGGTPSYNYSWAPVFGNTATVSGLAAGTYTVNVTDQHNCPAAISIVITQPTVLTSSIGSAVDPTCFGSSNGSASIVVGGGAVPYTYLWSDSQTGSTANNLLAGSYTVTATDANGCTTSETVTLSQPSQIITSAGFNDTICLGSSGAVSATATGGHGGYTYAWQPNGVTNAGTLIVSPTTNTTYTVIAYDQLGCAGTSDTVSAIVYSLSGANVNAVTSVTPICPGQSSTVSVQINGSTGPLTYLWNHGLGNSAGPITVSPVVTTTYIVAVSNSCGATVNDTVDVVISPPPTVLLSTDPGVICSPHVVQFYDNSVSGNINDPVHYWLWNFGDGTTSTSVNPTHVYTQPGTYLISLTVTTGNGCTNSNINSPLLINAFPTPVAAFTVNSTVLDLPYDVLITNNQSTGANSYFWSFGDGYFSNAVSPQYLYTTVGTFPIQLIATSQYGCADTAYSEVTTSADIVFPTAFTPGEGTGGTYDITSLTNDVFFPYTSGVSEFKMQIFNRWGELIFETFDLKKGWDGYYRGKICQQDVYIWKAYIKLNNGKIFNKTGDVTLLR